MSANDRRPEKERTVDESMLEDQFDEFLSRLEIMESEEFNGMDDDDFDAPAKDRVLMIKLDKTAFEPLLSVVKTTSPTLYQGLLQHSLVSGQQKFSRKQSRKEKKRDRKHERDRERERVLQQAALSSGGKLTRAQRREKNIGSFSELSGGIPGSSGLPGSANKEMGSLVDLGGISSEKKGAVSREVLAAVVAKSIAEGSISGYLITIALLLQTMKEEEEAIKKGSNDNSGKASTTGVSNSTIPGSSEGRSGRSGSTTSELQSTNGRDTVIPVFVGHNNAGSMNSFVNRIGPAIPIGNILAAIFERPEGDDESVASDVAGASSTNGTHNSTTSNSYIPNPFHAYLLSSRDEPAKSVAFSDVLSGDGGSVDESHTEDTASQAGGYHGPFSDAGSNVGSTLAEQGTETASIAENDEDATEEELLAQALALSLRMSSSSPTVNASAQMASLGSGGSGSGGHGGSAGGSDAGGVSFSANMQQHFGVLKVSSTHTPSVGYSSSAASAAGSASSSGTFTHIQPQASIPYFPLITFPHSTPPHFLLPTTFSLLSPFITPGNSVPITYYPSLISSTSHPITPHSPDNSLSTSLQATPCLPVTEHPLWPCLAPKCPKTYPQPNHCPLTVPFAQPNTGAPLRPPRIQNVLIMPEGSRW